MLTVTRFFRPSRALGALFDYRRRKREIASNVTESNDDDVVLSPDAIDPPGPVVVPGPEGLHPNDTWPTPTGITREAATTSCETPIRNLPIFDVCDPYTVTQRQTIINSCILDIQVGWRNYRISSLGFAIELRTLHIYVTLRSNR